MSGKSSLSVVRIPELLRVATEPAQYSNEAHQESNQYVLSEGQLSEPRKNMGSLLSLVAMPIHFIPFAGSFVSLPAQAKIVSNSRGDIESREVFHCR